MSDFFKVPISDGQHAKLIEKYRKVFFNPLGFEVLADVLAQCHFGCTVNPDDKVQVAEHNVGIMILSRCGVFAPGTMKDVILALSAVQPG